MKSIMQLTARGNAEGILVTPYSKALKLNTRYDIGNYDLLHKRSLTKRKNKRKRFYFIHAIKRYTVTDAKILIEVTGIIFSSSQSLLSHSLLLSSWSNPEFRKYSLP